MPGFGRMGASFGRLGLPGGGGAAAPLIDPATLSPFAWWEPSDLTTLFQDAGTTPITADGQQVLQANDKSGNGRHLIDFGSAGPTYETAGGLHWLAYDGDNALYRDADMSLAQPALRITALRINTWGDDDRIWGGRSTFPGFNCHMNDTSDIRITTDDSNYVVMGNIPTGEVFVLTEYYDGADSYLQFNNESPVTGNVGSGSSGGMSCMSENWGSNRSHADLFVSIIIEDADGLSADDILALQRYAAAQGGVFF